MAADQGTIVKSPDQHGTPFPMERFARRSDIPLDQATCFELIVTLKSQGWHEQSAAKVKKKKSHDPFADGVLAQLMKPVTVI